MDKYLPLVITFILALIALFTDGSKLDSTGNKKLSNWGYLILLLIFISFGYGIREQYIQNDNLEKEDAQRIYIVSQEGKNINTAIKSILYPFYIIGRPNPSNLSHIRMDSKSNLEELDSLTSKEYWDRISMKNLYSLAWDSITYGDLFSEKLSFAQQKLEQIINTKTKYFRNSSIALIYEILSLNGLRNITAEAFQMKAKINFYQNDFTLYSAIMGKENFYTLLQKLRQLQNIVDQNQL